MQNASDLIKVEQRKQVEQAVKQAEEKTSCEIVPVVATASGRYDRPEDILGLWMAGVSVVAFWYLIRSSDIEPGDWGEVPLYAEILTLIAIIIIMFMLGVMLGSQIGPLRRLFTPRKQMQEEVDVMSRHVYFDRRVHHTASGTGILIYVSLYEQIAKILGDQVIMDHPDLGQPFLDELCKKLTERLKEGEEVSQALCKTILEAGEQLSGPLPRAEGDVNELHDALILIDTSS